LYWFVIDIVLAAIMVITALISMKRGFVSSLVRLLGVMVAIIAAVVVSRLLAGPLFDAFLRENLIDSVAEKIGEASDIDEYVLALKSGFIGILLGVFGDAESLAVFFEKAVFIDKGRLAAVIVDEVVRPPLESLVGMAVFILIFFLAYSIIALLVRLTGVLNEIPVIGFANRLFGMLFGAVYGLGICYVLVALTAFFFAVTGNSAKYEELIFENTLLFSVLFKANPVLR